MTLSDGTKVWLNSETQLKYPVSFTDSESRQVELVYGEAYFEVSPSTEHKGADFKVFHDHQEVQVLGTEFNIKAYKDETNIYTTLVEGKVAVNYNGNNQILAPNQQSNLNTENNNITMAMVDVYRETSWTQGVFIFKKKPLKKIMEVLSRWYDMEVVFENKELENVIFSGTFNKKHSIEDILTAIKNTKFINNYEINNKTIVIK
jgi:ferric-dicitrate binding protein FerR (iron transport regulator)